MESLPSNKLKNFQIENLTRDDFESASGILYIDAPNALADAVNLNDAKLAVSTFGGNGIIPNQGAISTVTFTDAAAGSDIQPAVGEVWQIDNLFMSAVLNGSSGTPNAIVIAITDGTTRLDIHAFAAAPGTTTPIGSPASSSLKLYLTNDLYLNVRGDQSDTSSIYVPYQMVVQ